MPLGVCTNAATLTSMSRRMESCSPPLLLTQRCALEPPPLHSLTPCAPPSNPLPRTQSHLRMASSSPYLALEPRASVRATRKKSASPIASLAAATLPANSSMGMTTLLRSWPGRLGLGGVEVGVAEAEVMRQQSSGHSD